MLQWVSKIFNANQRAASKRKFLTLAVFVILGVVFFSLAAQAQTGQPIRSSADLGVTNEIGDNLGLVNEDLRVIIARILRVAFGLVGIVFVGIAVYGGFIWMTSQGNENRISEAKSIIFNGIIGVAIMLSAFAITSFIISKLINGINGIFGDGTGGNVNVNLVDQNFFGTGALGGIVRDHYPARNQTEVPRNAKIIITFRRAVVPSSFIVDTTGNGVYGDCRNVGQPGFNWENDCDQVRLDDQHINITAGVSSTPVRGASALASVEPTGVFTIVLRPFDSLGSDSERIPYNVRVGNAILLDDQANGNPSIFEGRASGQDYYEWYFVCSTALDTTPPRVQSVFPANGVTETTNSIIQINFTKAMDPSVIQGALSAGSGYFVLNGNAVFLRAPNSTVPAGTFRLVNNYRTLEFTPNSLCGQNSCGNDVYCMPVCNAGGATCTTENYQVLLRAAQTFSTASFEAVPFSGLADVSGNALDGNANGTVDNVARTANVFPDEQTGDNYYWQYSLNRELDLTPPYLIQVVPGLDATYVNPSDDLSMLFSKKMRAESLYNIKIDESPAPTGGSTICFVPSALFNSDNSTLVTLFHCPFNASERHYYYPVADSTVEDSHFNCFYPGLGPNGLNATTNASTICDSSNITTCCAINGANPLCCNGAASASDKDACLNSLKAASPP